AADLPRNARRFISEDSLTIGSSDKQEDRFRTEAAWMIRHRHSRYQDAFSPFGTSGRARNLMPVASKIAFAIAGASPIIGHSPAPTDGMSLRSSSTVSITGTSLKRGTRYCDNLPFRILPFSNSMASNSAPPR